jgi:hypothetical protein
MLPFAVKKQFEPFQKHTVGFETEDYIFAILLSNCFD